MRKTKLLNAITCFLLAVVCLFSGIFYNKDTTSLPNAATVAVRDLNVNEIGSLSYEEKVEEILSEFDVYSYDYDDTTVQFHGTLTKDFSDFSGFEYLNTLDETKITRTFITKFNGVNNTFSLLITTTQNEEIIEQIEEEVVPIYDEIADDYYIVLDDGTTISVTETLILNNLNPCIAGIDDIAIGGLVVISMLAIAAAPSLQDALKPVYNEIKSFFKWVGSLFRKDEAPAKETFTYHVSYQGNDYALKAYAATRFFDLKSYYLALADTDDGLLYVSTKPVSRKHAISAFTASTYVTSVHKGSNKKFVLSVYTPLDNMAYDVALSAGEAIGDPGVLPHPTDKPGYFNHYHPGGSYNHPHCFYGTPFKK